MLNTLWIVVQIVSLMALIYGAWLVFTNRGLLVGAARSRLICSLGRLMNRHFQNHLP